MLKRFCILVVLALCFFETSGVFAISNADYYDKVHGAWLGKCIGGALGIPLEGWSYTDIDKKYPVITDYTGYVPSAWTNWSGMLLKEKIDDDGNWHHETIIINIPEFDKSWTAIPIIGMTKESSTKPASWQIRDLKIIRPDKALSFDHNTWATTSACYWLDAKTVNFNFSGERCWLKLNPTAAGTLDIKPNDKLLLSFDVKWLSGDNTIGFALDYFSGKDQKGFGPDDDTSYQIIGLHTLEKVGPDISCRDIGKEWCALLPDLPDTLAEGLALERMKKGILPPESGQHPIGEAIGGQMKGEIWGLICPGRPDLAAEYARRDGVVAHCKNGVYGEQFIAAMISASFSESDPAKLIQVGLSVIPRDSKYADVVHEVIAWHEKYPDYRDTRREVKAKYPGVCDPVYAEAGIITLALLYGEGDFEKTICIAAKCGSDTDCNTASVGALIGCIHGAKAIPMKWKDPIGDRFCCFVKGLEYWSISDISRRICAAGRKVQAYHGNDIKFTSDL